MRKPPFPIIVIGALFIVAGAAGLIYHLHDQPFDRGALLLLFVRLLAVVSGIFLLLGHNWARWLLIAWLAFHVSISAFHSIEQTVVHALLLAVVAYFLFRPPASTYLKPQAGN